MSNWPYPWLNNSNGRMYILLKALVARMSSGLTVSPMMHQQDVNVLPYHAERHELLRFLCAILDGYNTKDEHDSDLMYVAYMPLKLRDDLKLDFVYCDRWLSNSLNWINYQVLLRHCNYTKDEHQANAFFIREIVVPLTRGQISPETAISLDSTLEAGILDD